MAKATQRALRDIANTLREAGWGEITVLGDVVAGDRYVDQSSGPTGAKAFGRHAEAHSTGNVRQIISREEGDALVDCFEQLKSLAADVAQTQAALDEAIRQAAAVDPDASAVASAWQKAKTWIDAALATGTWAVAKAAKARGFVEKIQGLLSSAP